VISQAGERVSGTLSGRGGCQSESLAIDYLRRETLVSARLLRTTLRFTSGSCTYQGTVVGDPAAEASGTVTCSNLASTRLTLVGTWELRR
jgi:hypothetical protein